MDLSAGLEIGMGPSVVTWQALAHWCALTRTELEPWEARALVRLGAKRADVLAEQMKH